MKRSLLLSVCAATIVAMSLGQAMADVTLSLNLRYNDPNNTAAGGTWDLMAKDTSAFGISAIVAVIQGISAPTLNTGIGAIPIETKTSGGITEFVYGQDPNGVAGSTKFLNVGKGAGTPGNVAKDDLFPTAANPYDNFAKIASGNFGSTRPAIGTTITYPGASQGGITEAAVWDDAAMTKASATVPTIIFGGGDGVRGDSVSVDGLRPGDANRDGSYQLHRLYDPWQLQPITTIQMVDGIKVTLILTDGTNFTDFTHPG